MVDEHRRVSRCTLADGSKECEGTGDEIALSTSYIGSSTSDATGVTEIRGMKARTLAKLVWIAGREGFGKWVDGYFLALSASEEKTPSVDAEVYRNPDALLVSPSVSVAVSSPETGCEICMGFPCFLKVRTPSKAS